MIMDINYETSPKDSDCANLRKMGSKYKHNLQGSSAKGIFQFIDNTLGKIIAMVMF